eukprot:3630176-Amphidinium_carterae.1
MVLSSSVPRLCNIHWCGEIRERGLYSMSRHGTDSPLAPGAPEGKSVPIVACQPWYAAQLGLSRILAITPLCKMQRIGKVGLKRKFQKVSVPAPPPRHLQS